jgi:hypothetical protein
MKQEFTLEQLKARHSDIVRSMAVLQRQEQLVLQEITKKENEPKPKPKEEPKK